MNRRILPLIGALTLSLTAAAAAPANALAASLFSDNFEQDVVGSPAPGWTVVTGTWVVATDGTQVLKETDTDTSTRKSIWAGSPSWTDYNAVAQVKLGDPTQSNVMSARYQDDNNAYAVIIKNGNEWYFGKKVAGNWTTFTNGTMNFDTSTWYTLEIDAVGSSITGYINGTKLGAVNDTSLSSGAINFMSRTTFEADNVVVSPAGPTPTPTPTPTATPTPTPSPTATPTPTPTPTPTATPTPTPTATPTPTPTPTATPTPTPSPTPSGSGTIAGTVTSVASGTPIAGATVTTVPATHSATTAANGTYTLAAPAGTYSVVFSAPGYNTDFTSGVSVSANASTGASKALIKVAAGTAQDLFSRPDQTGTGVASDGHTWSNDSSTYPSATASISQRRLYVQTAAAVTDLDVWMGNAYSNQVVQVDFNQVNVVQDPAYQHGARLLARVTNSTSWVELCVNEVDGTLTLWVSHNDVWTQLATSTLPTQLNTWYTMKLQVSGTTVNGKVWVAGTAEPGWQISGTQGQVTNPGQAGIRTTASDVYYRNFTETQI